MELSDTFGTTVALAATIATAIATGFALLFSMWWRRVDARRPDWIWYEPYSAWTEDRPTMPSTGFTLANAGVGPAFAMSAVGVNCEAHIRDKTFKVGTVWKEIIPLFETGATASVDVNAIPDEWETCAVVVVWSEPRTWSRKHKRRSLLIPLSDVNEAPVFKELNPDTAIYVPVTDPSKAPSVGPIEPDFEGAIGRSPGERRKMARHVLQQQSR